MRLIQRLLWAAAGLLIFASLSFAAEGGAISRTNARTQAGAEAAANLGAGGGGADLRAIASPKKPQTLTGFPAGTLPGDSLGGGGGGSEIAFVGKAVPSGEELPPYMGFSMIGATFDHVCAVASHVGYTVVRRADQSNSLDAFYTFDVLRGRSRKARLYLDRSLRVLWVEN